jgi:hypothetical protein
MKRECYRLLVYRQEGIWETNEQLIEIEADVERTYLLDQFGSQVWRLLSFDSKSRNWESQISMFQSLSTLQRRVDFGCIDRNYLRDSIRYVASEDIQGIVLWVAGGKRCLFELKEF